MFKWPWKRKKVICEYREIRLDIPYRYSELSLGDILRASGTDKKYFVSGLSSRVDKASDFPNIIYEVKEL